MSVLKCSQNNCGFDLRTFIRSQLPPLLVLEATTPAPQHILHQRIMPSPVLVLDSLKNVPGNKAHVFPKVGVKTATDYTQARFERRGNRSKPEQNGQGRSHTSKSKTCPVSQDKEEQGFRCTSESSFLPTFFQPQVVCFSLPTLPLPPPDLPFYTPTSHDKTITTPRTSCLQGERINENFRQAGISLRPSLFQNPQVVSFSLPPPTLPFPKPSTPKKLVAGATAPRVFRLYEPSPAQPHQNVPPNQIRHPPLGWGRHWRRSGMRSLASLWSDQSAGALQMRPVGNSTY